MTTEKKKLGFLFGLICSIGFTVLGGLCAWSGYSSQLVPITPSEKAGLLYACIGGIIGLTMALIGAGCHYRKSRLNSP